MIWDDTKIVAFDFETSGILEEYALQPWRAPGDAWTTSMSVIRWMVENDMPRLAPDGSRLLQAGKNPWMYPELHRAIRDFLERAIANDWWVVGWNVIFDIQWCIAYGCGDLVHKVKWLDAMLLWKHLTIEPEYELDRSKKKSYSLKMAVPEYMPIEHHGYEDNIDFHATDPISLAKLQKYNDRDSVYTWVLAKIFWSELTERQRAAALIEASSLSLVAEANLRGLPVDMIYAAELSAKLAKDAADMLTKLAPHGVTEKIVRSPAQLGKLLFDDWKLPVLKENTGKKTGKVSRATDKEVLHELAFIDPRCADLRTYRESLGNRTKFADTPMASATYNADFRSRPAGIVFGTYTGRMTYASDQGKGVNKKQTGFALHQEKRGKEFRSIIVAPPGYTLMEFDAAGQEYRWMAILSGDQTMMELCLPGEDPHCFLGGRVAGQDYREIMRLVKEDNKDAEQIRYLGKFANFSLAYRTGPKKLRSKARVEYLIPLELPEAQRIHRTYQQTYTRVPKYWDHQIRKVKQLGYAETLAGRRVQVVGDWDGKNAWSMEGTSLNYPVQGTGGDQKYLAMQVLKPLITRMGAYFAWDLHDGIYLWVPDDKVEQMAVEGKRLLDALPYREAWGFTSPIPLPWDCKYGPGWGALKEWKNA